MAPLHAPPWSTTRLVWIFLLVHISQTGRFIEYQTDGTIKVALMNDHGVPVSGFTKILFEVKACANAVFVLSETSSFTTKNSKYFMVMLGASKTKRLNGIKDSCFKCSTFHATVMKTTVTCNDFKSYFVTWNNKGSITIGEGTDSTKVSNVFLEYNSTKKFALNFINVMSLKNNATWRFRVDSGPQFSAPLSHGATVIKVSEDTQTDKEIFRLRAWDPEDDNITFSLGDKHRDVFKVEGESLMLIKNLDYETQSFYSIDVSVSDGFNSVPVAMAIRVTDVNDEPPTLNYNDDVKVPEEMPVGYVISGLFSATDRDTNDSMTFMLEGPQSTFLNLSDNVLRIQERIDHDGSDGHSSLNGLTFRVFDSMNHESNITKNITIMDMNDNAPKFPQHVYRVNATENSTSDTFLLQLSAIDNDSGGNGQVVYSLDGENETTKYFKLNGSDLFVDGDRIDLETMPDEDSDELLLTVVAVDTPDFEQPQTGSATIRLKIISKNEYDPVWTSPKVDNNTLPEMNISEDAASLTTVVVLTAKDEDRGEDGQISYSIESIKTGSGSDSNKTFWIDSKTGGLKTAAALDSDTSTGGEEYYDVTLMASDSGSSPRNVTASVRIHISNVNDNPPSFNNTVMEVPLSKSLGKGDLVVSLVATDPDGDKMTFSLAGQSKDLFEYDGKELKAAKKINPKTSYVLILKASDGIHEVAATAIIGGGVGQNGSSSASGSGSGSGTGTGSGGEMVVEALDGVEVPEEYPVGLPIPSPFTVLGGGKDNALTYALSGEDSSMFDIDSKTGVMKLKQRVDTESNTTKTLFDGLAITVTDSDGKKKEANVSLKFIDINDNEPKFDQMYIFANATENSANDTLVTQLTYSDLDQGVNGNVTLNISGDSSIFRIDDNKLYVDGSQLDFEDKNLTDQQHVVVILAVDNPTSGQAKTGQAVVVVKILPRNEHDPVWSQPELNGNGSFPNKSLANAATPLAEVGTFSATDQDGGADGHVTYSVVSAVSESGENVTNTFVINSLTGTLVTTAHVDSGASKPSPYYDVVIGAEDGGTPPKIVEGKIRVFVDVARVVSPLMKAAQLISLGSFQGSSQRGSQSGFQSGSQGSFQGGPQSGSQGGSQSGIQGSSQSGSQGGSQSGTQGSSQSGSQGGTQGSSQSGSQGGSQNGTQGSSQGGSQNGTQGSSQGGFQNGTQGGFQNGTQGSSQNGTQGSSQGGTQGSSQSGVQGGTQGSSQGGTQGSSQGGTQGSSQGGTQGGTKGSSQGGTQGSSQGGTQGSSQGGTQGSSQGGTQGSSQGGTQGSSQGGIQGGSKRGSSGGVYENMAVGSVIKNFTDAFPGSDKMVLTVTGKWNETFGFEGLALKLLRKLDYETTRIHFLDIKLSDGKREDTTVMTIDVKDVTDEPPEIHTLSTFIPEELPPLSVIGRIFKVTDKDYRDKLTYTLTGFHAKYFNIDASTGQMTMKETLDRDGTDGVELLDQLILTVADSAGLTTNSSLNLTVLDMNDNNPILSSTVLNLNVTENSTSGIVLSTMTCQDPDEGPNGNCSLELITDPSIFKLNGSDLTADGSVIDYEALSGQQYMYTITVSLTDHPEGSEPRTSSTTITVKVRLRVLSLT